MREGKKHMDKNSRVLIEEGVYDGKSCRSIASSLAVAPSTVSRELRNNRTVVVPPKRPGAKLAVRCVNYRDCQIIGGACGDCRSQYVHCKDCRARSCIDTCPRFELRMCETTERWPYVCPKDCPKRSRCTRPKCRYRAEEAHAAHASRLVSSRQGVDATEEELDRINAVVAPLVRQGWSFEAIHSAHADELGVSVRTLYNYQELGILETSNIELPRKARMRPRRRRKGEARARIDRTGRLYSDFRALPIDEQARVVQGDSVEGFRWNGHDILSLHIVARKVQLYLRKRHADPDATVACLDDLERAMGSREAFAAAFDPLLLDRGVEFDDFEGIERSCLEPGARRCRVFYCDAQDSNQKSQAERNHEQLRRILPKERTNMDALSDADVAECCSHVNSYPLASLGGRSPFECMGALVPVRALERLGIRILPRQAVILKPSLMKHAVDQ